MKMLRESRRKWLPQISLAAAAMVLLAMGPAHAAKPKPGSCPLIITACGCTITTAGTFVVANDLSAAQTTQPNCIEIAASNSILNVTGFKILGNDNGKGIGILIQRGAENVIVEGTSLGDPSAKPPVPPSPQAKVNLWNIGIEDDGNNAIIAMFQDIGGSLLMDNPNAEPKGNGMAGIFLNGVTNSFIGTFNANFNGKFGVLVTNSTGVTMATFTTERNKDTGVKLDSSNDASIGPGAAQNNGKFGMWLAGSSRNTIHDSNGNFSNGDTGIRLSCAAGKACPGAGGSNDNRITNAGAPNNTLNGIVIEKGNGGNVVTVTHNQGNGGPNDMTDLNPDCDGNTWYNNVGRGNQACNNP